MIILMCWISAPCRHKNKEFGNIPWGGIATTPFVCYYGIHGVVVSLKANYQQVSTINAISIGVTISGRFSVLDFAMKGNTTT